MTYCTDDDVRDALRLTGTPTFDVARITRANQSATEAIDAWLDRIDPVPDPTPASIVQANINLAVLEYLTPGAAAAALSLGTQAAATGAPPIPVPGIPNLTPWKQQFGVA